MLLVYSIKQIAFYYVFALAKRLSPSTTKAMATTTATATATAATVSILKTLNSRDNNR